jgi:hypothetical protein
MGSAQSHIRVGRSDVRFVGVIEALNEVIKLFCTEKIYFIIRNYL